MLKRIVCAAPLAVLGATWFFAISLPWPLLLPFRNPGETAFMEQRVRQARSRGDTLRLRHTWKPLNQISRNLRRAVVIAEDARFYEHEGIDWLALQEEVRYRGDDNFSWFQVRDVRALLGSLNYYRTHRDRIRGRSTITQQLAKNLYFSEERSLSRKAGEFIVARRLELFLDKNRILELYLNVVELGPGVFGAEAASRYYFGRSARNLTADQAATLAATLPQPLTANPRRRPGRLNWRKQMILARMGVQGPVQTVPLEEARYPLLTDSAAATPQRDSVVRGAIPLDTVTARSMATSRAIWAAPASAVRSAGSRS